MSHSPYLNRSLPAPSFERPSLRAKRVNEHTSPTLIPSLDTSATRSGHIAEERAPPLFSISDKPLIRPVRAFDETGHLPLRRPSISESHVVEDVSPVHISPIKRRCIRDMTGGVQEVNRVVRRRSVEPLHRGVLSNKVPLTFGHIGGVTVHPIPFASLEGEEKLTLYSEVERLTILNLQLKKQLDMMFIELEQQRSLAIRAPELELAVHDLQAEILQKDQDFSNTIKEHELLKIDYEDLSKLGPAYNELLEHNKMLIGEIDGLDMRLKDLLHERDALEAQAESVKMLQPRLEDATRRIEIMTDDIIAKDEEIIDCRGRIQELGAKIDALVLEKEQVHNRSVDYLKERDMLLVRIDEMEKAHEGRMTDLRIQMENSNRAFIEHERAQITDKCSAELAKKEEDVQLAYRLVKSYEGKLLAMTNEIENLEKTNLSKANEIDDLKMRICLLEEEKREAVKISEIESSIKMERQLAQQRNQYEINIAQLKKELAEADRVRLVLKQKENEIEVMKTQLINNEKVWELKLQKAVDTEVKSASSKFVLELSALETEASMNKDAAVKFENQINFLTNELERMNHSQNQKIIEINELQRKMASQEVNNRLALEEQKTKLEIEKKQSLEELRRDLERIHVDRIDEMRRFQATLEERLMVIVDENNRLNAIVDDRTKDVDSYSLKLRVMEDVYKQQVDELHKKTSMSQKMTVEKEISSATIKHKGEKAELEYKVVSYSADVDRLRAQYQLQGAEIERLTQGIKDKELEIQQEKRRYVELEIQRTRDITEIREQFDSYKRANIDVNTLQVRFEAERTSLASQIMQHKDKVNELEKRLLLALGENDKARALYNEKVSELEMLRHRYRELEERLHNEMATLENENEFLKRANLDGKEISIKYSSEKIQYENQIKQLKTINENGKQELEKLYELMNQRKKEHDYYVKQNDELKKEVDRLSRQLRDAGSETTSRKDKHEEFERKVMELERDRDLYREHNERLNTQLKQTHAELEEKIREIDLTKKKYDESISKLSTQLDKDLMSKMMGGSVVSTSVEKKERLSFSGMEF